MTQRGEINIYTLFEEERLEGMIDGEAKGIIKMGYEFGLSENDILSKLQKNLNVSLQAVQEYLNMFGRKTV